MYEVLETCFVVPQKEINNLLLLCLGEHGVGTIATFRWPNGASSGTFQDAVDSAAVQLHEVGDALGRSTLLAESEDSFSAFWADLGHLDKIAGDEIDFFLVKHEMGDESIF